MPQALLQPPPPPPHHGELASNAARWGFLPPVLDSYSGAGPPPALPPRELDYGRATAAYRVAFAPTASQLQQYALLLRHRLSSLWGPPGSGKTYWAVR